MKEVSSIFGGKSVVQSKSSAEHILALKQKLRVTLKNARECPPSPGLPPPSGSQGTPPPSGSQVMAPSPSQETEVKEIKAQAKPKLLKEIKSSDIKPKDTKPKEVKPKPKEIKPKEIKPKEIKPKEIKPKEIKPKEIKPKEIKPKDIKPKEIKPKEIKPKEIKPKDIKPKEIKPKEIKPKDVKVKAKAKSLVKPPVDFDGPLPLDVIKKRRLDGGDEPLQKCMRLEKSGNEVEKGGMDSLVRRLEASPSFKPPVVKPPDVPKSDFKGPLSLDSLLKLKPEGETDPLEPAALAVPMTAKPPPLKNDTVPQPPSTRSKAASRPSRTHAFPNIDGLEKQGQIQRPTPSVRLHESVRRPLPLRAIVAQAVLSSDETPGMAEVSPATPKLQPVEVDDEAEPPKKGVDVPTAPLTQLELQDVADRPEPDVLDSESRRLAAERRTARLQRTNALMRTKILSEFPLSDEIRPLLAPHLTPSDLEATLNFLDSFSDETETLPQSEAAQLALSAVSGLTTVHTERYGRLPPVQLPTGDTKECLMNGTVTAQQLLVLDEEQLSSLLQEYAETLAMNLLVEDKKHFNLSKAILRAQKALKCDLDPVAHSSWSLEQIVRSSTGQN